MKVFSLWQPFATLLVRGFKTVETRTWPAPASIVGQRVGIASTKNIKPEQRAHFADENFQHFYSMLGLPAQLEAMPMGYLLGTAIFDSQEIVTPELLEDISLEEQQYGWFEVPGRTVWIWRMREPVCLEHPIPIRGAQGLYDWNGFEAQRLNSGN